MLTSVIAVTGTLADLRRAVISLWFARQREPDGPDARTAQTEADRRGGEADRAELRAHEDRSQAVLTEFIQAGGRQLL